MFLGHPTYLNPKGVGDKSMLGKRWVRATGAGTVPQDLCAMVRGRHPEPQSPLGESALPSEHRLITDAAVCGGLNREPPQPPHSRRWPMRPFKGMNGAPTARSDRRQRRTAGHPTGGDAHGCRVLIVVVGVTPDQGTRESRVQGEGEQGDGKERGKGAKCVGATHPDL